MPGRLHAEALQRMAVLGYGEFSDYIQALIRADTGLVAGKARGE